MLSTNCGWCGRYANMTRVGDDLATVLMQDFLHSYYQVMATYRCNYCNRFLLASTAVERERLRFAADALDDPDDEAHVYWHPYKGSEPPQFEDVPDSIRHAAQEAYRDRSIQANRSAVLMARAVVEATAKEMGIVNGSLINKIDAMRAQDLIREHIKDGAHEIRYLGNEMAHGDFIEPIDDEDTDLVLALMSEVLEEVFQSPARVARAKAKRDAKNAGAHGPT